MRVQRIATSALLAYGATAFKNTSPFFLLSTSQSVCTVLLRDQTYANSCPSLPDIELHHVQLASASSISMKTLSLLDSCPSDAYIIVSQPDVAASDYTSKSTAHLRQWLNKTGNEIPSSWMVPEVIGDVDSEKLVQHLQTKCGADVLKVDASSMLDLGSSKMNADFLSFSWVDPKRGRHSTNNQSRLHKPSKRVRRPRCQISRPRLVPSRDHHLPRWFLPHRRLHHLSSFRPSRPTNAASIRDGVEHI